MRLRFSSLLTALLLPSWLAADDLPTVKAVLPDIAVAKNSAIAPINLQNHFEVTSISNVPGRVVQMRFVYGLSNTTGTVNVEMLPGSAPNSVANFLAYVNGGKYSNTVVHRSVPVSAGKGYGIIQGGGFVSPSMTDVVTDPPIALEYNLPNTRGTIALARQTAPDTATSGWFFNTIDNSTVFAPSNGGGYATFGRVTGSGMTVVDAIAALPVYIGTSLFGGAFGEFPLAGYANPPGYLDSNAVRLTSATVATVFPSTIAVNVVNSSTTTKLVTVTVVPPETSLPPELAIGSTLLGSTVESVVGNFVFLKDNANRTINTVTSVPFTKAGEASVVTFSVENSNPSLLAATVTGSALEMFLKKDRGGFANIVVKATDSNGNVAQIPFRVTVAGGNSTPSDLDGDGIDDLFLQYTAGSIVGWVMNGSGVLAAGKTIFSGSLGDWKAVGVADLNLDGNADVIFQNAAGQVAGWLMNGTGVVTGSVTIYGGGLGDWRIVACGDLNKDGIPDLVFQNTVGQVSAWLMNGAGAAATAVTISGTGLGDWRVRALGDLNSDGIPDLVLQNSQGLVYGWLMNGAGLASSGVMVFPSSLGDWRVNAMADLNSDGIADLVFQNNAGQIVGWPMNGSGSRTGGIDIYSGVLSGWRLF